jgi:ferredoxin
VSIRVEPDLHRDFAKFGGDDAVACMNCGNCTVTCPLSTETEVFPRKIIHYLQVGMKDKLLQSADPWLCYYCGDCSKDCPREANPGETMMAARRYLTALYDWTSLSRKMYRSTMWEIGSLVLVGLAVVLLFVWPDNFGFGLLRQFPDAQSTVMLNRFAPKEIVHWGDMILAAMLAFFLLTNAARMAHFVLRGKKLPFLAYVTYFYELIVHGLTQKRWKRCDGKNTTTHWVRHIVLVTGYGTMFLLVVLFLPWFQVENTSFHWTSLFGYYGALALMGVTVWIIVDRARKRAEMHKFSHLSDWLFPILLFLTALSGILLHLFRLLDLAMATYYIYVAHLAIAVPMLVVEVPFGKWAHLLYRPLAIYLTEIRQKAKTQEPRPEIADAAA